MVDGLIIAGIALAGVGIIGLIGLLALSAAMWNGH